MLAAALIVAVSTSAAAAKPKPFKPFATQSFVCAAPDQPRYRLIYAHPADTASAYAKRAPQLLAAAAAAGGEINRQHQLQMPSQRVQLPISCSVDDVVLSTVASATTFETIKADLRAQGLGELGSQTPERLFVLMDWRGKRAISYAGETESFTPMGPQIASLSGLVSLQHVYKDAQSIERSTTLHELLHSMGAVWDPAPGAGGGGHCMDGPDVLCRTGKARGSCQDWTIDCGSDSYYAPRVAPQQYLARGWNLAGPKNLWLRIAERSTSPEPAAPSPVRSASVISVLSSHQALLAVEGGEGADIVAWDSWLRGIGHWVSPGVVLFDRIDMAGAAYSQPTTFTLAARASGVLSAPGAAVSIEFPADVEAPTLQYLRLQAQKSGQVVRFDGSSDVAYYQVQERRCARPSPKPSRRELRPLRCSWKVGTSYSGGAGPYRYRVAPSRAYRVVAVRVRAGDIAGNELPWQTLPM